MVFREIERKKMELKDDYDIAMDMVTLNFATPPKMATLPLLRVKHSTPVTYRSYGYAKTLSSQAS